MFGFNNAVFVQRNQEGWFNRFFLLFSLCFFLAFDDDDIMFLQLYMNLMSHMKHNKVEDNWCLISMKYQVIL